MNIDKVSIQTFSYNMTKVLFNEQKPNTCISIILFCCSIFTFHNKNNIEISNFEYQEHEYLPFCGRIIEMEKKNALA